MSEKSDYSFIMNRMQRIVEIRGSTSNISEKYIFRHEHCENIFAVIDLAAIHLARQRNYWKYRKLFRVLSTSVFIVQFKLI